VEAVSEILKPHDAPPGIYGPDGRPHFFSDPAMDRFAAAFTMLAAEVWVVKETLANIQALAEEKGVRTAAEVRAVAAGAEGSAARDAELAAFLHRVLGPMRED
jgi:hypothetical protein